MTSAILGAGLLMVAGLAVAMVRPSLRLPALAFALLALPGNVDDLLPQMSLDPHPVAGQFAPVVSTLDLLIAWAIILTLREGRRLDRREGRLVGLAVVLALAATLTAVANGLTGVDFGPALRGVILFWRIAALLLLALALRTEMGDGRWLAGAIVLGGVVLLANGIYTTIGDDLDRFTAKTFGRNGFAIALTVVIVAGSGLAFDLWSHATNVRMRLAAIGIAGVAGVSLIGMSATGTRMAFVVLMGAALSAVVLYPGRIRRHELRGIAVTGLLAVVLMSASVALTGAGGRTLSVITDPDTTVGVVTDPGSLPTETEIRSRGEFWALASDMALANPLTGVGPFQWNVQRYVLDPESPIVVADAHQTYLQIAAEYGFIVLGLYLALLLTSVIAVGSSLVSRRVREWLGWSRLGIVIASAVIPIAALTNAHVINPRNGPLEWLLIGSAIAYVLNARRATDTAERASGAPAGEPAAPALG